MSRDSQSPKTRYRFGFSGLRRRRKTTNATTDDILESLTRHSKLTQRTEPEDDVNMTDISESENLTQFEAPSLDTPSGTTTRVDRNLGQIILALMLLCGLTIVGVYASVSKHFDISALNQMLRNSGIGSVFTNQDQLAIIALVALIGALWTWRRRRTSLKTLAY